MGGCTVTMNASKSVTATFTGDDQQLTVTVSGAGTVTSSPPGISCVGPATCVAPYALNTAVTLTAVPSSVVWSGACTADPCTVTMDGPKSVTATFS
jgi:hypothetical protein